MTVFGNMNSSTSFKGGPDYQSFEAKKTSSVSSRDGTSSSIKLVS